MRIETMVGVDYSVKFELCLILGIPNLEHTILIRTLNYRILVVCSVMEFEMHIWVAVDVLAVVVLV